MSDDLSPNEEADEMIAKVSDYLDGLLSPADKDDVGKKIESDPAWKQTHEEMLETRKALSGLQKARAPGHFAQDVTETINKRSQGRFFGRRTFGDRVPLVPLVVVAVMALVVIAYVMWSSETGSLKVHHEHEHPGSAVELRPGL
jgi:anti-sigma factor RsiW